jgi:citrate lyase subunit beta/citryl-CoA lyase
VTSQAPIRSWLFAPGHSEGLLDKVFRAGADAVVLDLEDAVPRAFKAQARSMVAATIRDKSAWVRINVSGSADAAADLEAVAEHAEGIRIPKVESADHVAWVAQRAPRCELACTIETARGLMAAAEIAAVPQCRYLILGAADLTHDLSIDGGFDSLLYARSHLVVVSRAAEIEQPVDGAYLGSDGEGVREAAEHARNLGFGSKSAIRPHQVPIINGVFQPSEAELARARRIIETFEASGGAATRLPEGDIVDLPVANRARRMLSQGADA